MSYTAEQEKAVIRVMRLTHTDFYGHLLVEKTCTSSEIKRAYKKQALIMHPDKNQAPQADEAFKRIVKAFQILSDDQKRRIYDQTGQDPDSRNAGMGGGFGNPFGGGRAAQNPFGNGGFRAGNADDIFTTFFGGPGAAGGPQFQFQFGDGSDIFNELFQDMLFGGMRQPRQRRQARNPDNSASDRFSTYLTTFIIVAILILPTLFSALFGSSSSSASNMPSYSFKETSDFAEQRNTPKYDIPYFVKPDSVKSMPDSKLRKMDYSVENQYISIVKAGCNAEYHRKQQMMQDAVGWFFTDEDAYQAAVSMHMPNCEIMEKLGIRMRG